MMLSKSAHLTCHRRALAAAAAAVAHLVFSERFLNFHCLMQQQLVAGFGFWCCSRDSGYGFVSSVTSVLRIIRPLVCRSRSAVTALRPSHKTAYALSYGSKRALLHNFNSLYFHRNISSNSNYVFFDQMKKRLLSVFLQCADAFKRESIYCIITLLVLCL